MTDLPGGLLGGAIKLVGGALGGVNDLVGGVLGGGAQVVAKTGDTLSSIADAHGVPLSTVVAANPQVLHPDLGQPGQAIAVPQGGPPPAPPAPAPPTAGAPAPGAEPEQAQAPTPSNGGLLGTLGQTVAQTATAAGAVLGQAVDTTGALVGQTVAGAGAGVSQALGQGVAPVLSSSPAADPAHGERHAELIDTYALNALDG